MSQREITWDQVAKNRPRGIRTSHSKKDQSLRRRIGHMTGHVIGHGVGHMMGHWVGHVMGHVSQERKRKSRT